MRETLLKVSCVSISSLFEVGDVNAYVLCLAVIANVIRDHEIQNREIQAAILSSVERSTQIYSKEVKASETNKLACDVIFQLTKTRSLDVETFLRYRLNNFIKHKMLIYREQCFMIIGWFAQHYPEWFPQLEITWLDLAVDLEPRDQKQLEDPEYPRVCAILCWALSQYLNFKPDDANHETIEQIIRLADMYWPNADFLFRKYICLLLLTILYHRNAELITLETMKYSLTIFSFAQDLGHDEEISAIFAHVLIKLKLILQRYARDEQIETAFASMTGDLIQYLPESELRAQLCDEHIDK